MTIVKCPTCDKDVQWSKESKFRPFCCERCKLIDLGDWANETNTIAGTTNPDLAPELVNFDEFDLPVNDDFFQSD